jgi:hypothetical protein
MPVLLQRAPVAQGPGGAKRSIRPQAACSKGKGDPGGLAGVLNSYQPGTEKYNSVAAAAGENTADLVSQRQLQLLAVPCGKAGNGVTKRGESFLISKLTRFAC